MSRRLMDFLYDSWLLHPEHINECYQAFTDIEVRAELDRYRCHVDSVRAELNADTAGADELTTWVEGTEDDLLAPTPILRKAALYFDRTFVADPFFPHTKEPHQLEEATNKLLGFPAATAPRAELAQAARYIDALRPLIALDCVRLTPSTVLGGAPDMAVIDVGDAGSIRGVYENLIPMPELPEFFRKLARVQNLRKEGEGWISGPDVPKGPSRAIQVQFEGHRSDRIYVLFERELESYDAESGKMVVSQHFPEDKKPSGEEFKRWVDQSISGHATHIVRQLAHDLVSAEATGSVVMTRSKLVAGLLARGPRTPAANLQGTLGELAFRVELPMLDRLSFQEIADLRSNEGEAFLNYRVGLQKQLRGIHAADPSQLPTKLAEVSHELAVCQVREVQAEVNNLRKKHRWDWPLVLAGLVGGYALTPSFALAAARGLFSALHTQKVEHRTLGNKPAYFLWKANRLASARRRR